MKRIVKKMLLVVLMVGVGAVMHPAAGGDQTPAQFVIGSPEYMRQVWDGIIRITVEQFDALEPEIREKMINALIQHSYNDKTSAFLQAVNEGFAWAVGPLVAAGVDINKVICPELRDTYLMGAMAPFETSIELIRTLIANRALVDAETKGGETALQLIIKRRHRTDIERQNQNEIVRRRHTIDIERGNQEEIVRLLILAGADITKPCKVWRENVSTMESILAVAVDHGHLECLQILIDELRRLLERQYPTKILACLSARESQSLGNVDLASLQDSFEFGILTFLPIRDLAHLACVAKGFKILADTEMNKRFPRIKQNIFIDHLGQALRRTQCQSAVDGKNTEERVVLLQQALEQGYAMVVRPAECLGLESGHVAEGAAGFICPALEGAQAGPVACAGTSCEDMPYAVALGTEMSRAVVACAELARRAAGGDNGFECPSEGVCLAYDDDKSERADQRAARHAQDIIDRAERNRQDQEYAASLAADRRNQERKGKGEAASAPVLASRHELVVENAAGVAAKADELGGAAIDEHDGVVAAEHVVLVGSDDEETPLTAEERREMMAGVYAARLQNERDRNGQTN